MTVETDTAPVEEITITPRMAQIIEHMLQQPRGRHYCAGLAAELEINTGTITPLLHKMENAGWLESAWEDRAGAGQPKRLYRFTTGTAPMLRKALRG